MTKVVRTNRKMTVFTTVKTPCSTMLKTMRKKPHWYTKANRCCRNYRRVKKMKTKMKTEPESRTSTSMAEVTRILTMEEGLRNG